MKRFCLVVVLLCALSSCRTPKVLRYYASEETPPRVIPESEISDYVRVNAFVLDPESGSAKAIAGLSDRGQESFINALSSKTKTPQELMASLAMPIREPASPGSPRGSLTWKKRIVLNVIKADKIRANRVQQILFDLHIPEKVRDKVEFVSWDKIATETQTIDLGKITSTNSATLSFSPEITMAATLQGKAPGALSGTSTFNEEKSFSARLAGLNAALVNKSNFQVFRQALPNEDITGNIVVELTLKSRSVREVTVYTFNGLYEENKPVSDQSRIGLVKTVLVRPDFGTVTEIPIDLTYEFRYRKVGRGSRTEPEYDDEVSYVDGKHTEKSMFLLFDEAEARKVKTWEISDGTNYLHIGRDGVNELLIFDSPAAAGQLLSWIRQTQKLKVSDYQLFIGRKVLTNADIRNLEVVLSE